MSPIKRRKTDSRLVSAGSKLPRQHNVNRKTSFFNAIDPFRKSRSMGVALEPASLSSQRNAKLRMNAQMVEYVVGNWLGHTFRRPDRVCNFT